MSRRLHLLTVLIGATAMFVGCERNAGQPAAPSPLTNAQPALAGQPAQMAAKGAAQHVVTMFDACDPETFNAQLGAGTCTRSGGVRFDAFVDQLTKHHSIGAWHFAPPEVMMRVGERLVATNRGGETHTFTEVADFGGGKVPPLNEGLLPAPECAASQNIAAGQQVDIRGLAEGDHLFQCCIHPWMRAMVKVEQD